MSARRGVALAAVLLATVTAGASLAVAASGDPVPIAELQLAVKHLRECRLTTTGRVSGKPHTVTVWFVVDGDSLYLSTLDADRDWVRNALKAQTVTVDFGELAVTGRFQDITQTEFDERARAGLTRKYWLAMVAGWFGKGPERTFKVDGLRLVPAAAPAAGPAAAGG